MAQGRVRLPEVMRYLGYGGQDVGRDLAARIEEVAALCDAEARPRWVWRAFDLAPRPGRPAGVSGGLPVAGTALVLEGASAKRLLEGARSVALLACTLGADADRRLRALGATDPLGQLVYDAACSDLVEWAADSAQAEVAAWARERGLFCGRRFSPGYGDLPLEVQPRLLDVLGAPRRLGLTATRDLLLVPTKSVTAVIGIYPQPPRPDAAPLGCGCCALRTACGFRERGLRCYRDGDLAPARATNEP